jgi:nitrite reductase/ring-hydroxylating ferredoxin subunit
MRLNTNVQNICKLQSFTNKLDVITMHKLFLLLVLAVFFSCEKNETNDVLPDVFVDENINLNLPQYIDLQTPSGWTYTNGGIKGIVIQNTGIGSPPYKAFDRACPNNDCTAPMTFDGSLKMKCACDNSEYSIIDGSPQTAGNIHFAREYKVIVTSSSTLNISNF